MKLTKLAVMVVAVSTLSSCSHLKSYFCDCDKPAKAKTEVANSAGTSAEDIHIKPDPAERMLSGEIFQAMDAFVFKGEEKQMKEFCESPQVQCWLQNKKWPKGKKLNRKALQKNPFMTGSKMGLRSASVNSKGADERIQIRWEFFKKK